MRRSVKIPFVVIGCVLGAAIFFVAGLYVGGRAATSEMSVELDSTQAMLAFNRIEAEQRMKSLLSKDCVDAALKQVDIDQDKDTELLAEFFRGKLRPWMIRYATIRNPELVKSLATFKSKYGTVWEQPDCPKR